jgi:hypothetical protein
MLRGNRANARYGLLLPAVRDSARGISRRRREHATVHHAIALDTGSTPSPTSPSGSSAGCLASDTGLFIAEDIVNLFISLYRLSPVWHTRRMKTIVPANPYKNHRFPEEILNHAVWLYFRFG